MALSEEQKLKRIAEAQRTLGKASSYRHQPAVFDYAPTTQSMPRSLESLYANPSIDVYASAPVGGLGSEPGSTSPGDQDDTRERLDREADELLSQVSLVTPQADSAIDPGQVAPEQSANEVQPEQIERVAEPEIGPIVDQPSPVSMPQFQPIDAATFAPDPGDYTEPMAASTVTDHTAYGAPDMEAIQAGGNRMMARRTDLSHEQKMSYAAKSPKARKSSVTSAKASTTEIPPVGPASDPEATVEPPGAGSSVPQDEPLFGPSDVPMANQSVESPVTMKSIASDAEAPKAASNREQPRRSKSSPWPPAAPGDQSEGSPIRGVAQQSSDRNSGQSMMRQGPATGGMDTGSLEESGTHLLDSMTDLLAKLASLTINAQQRLDDIEQSLDGIYGLDEFEGG